MAAIENVFRINIIILIYDYLLFSTVFYKFCNIAYLKLNLYI